MSHKDFVYGAVFGACIAFCGFMLWLNYSDSVEAEARRQTMIQETKRYDGDLPDPMLMVP